MARLLCLGADPSARDGDGTTPLIAAAAAEGGGDARARGRFRRAATRARSGDRGVDVFRRRTRWTSSTASGSPGVRLCGRRARPGASASRSSAIAAGADVDAKTRTAGRRCSRRRSADTARSRWRWWRPAPTSTPPTTRARRRCTRRRSRTTRRRSPRWSPRAPTSTGASRRPPSPRPVPVLSTSLRLAEDRNDTKELRGDEENDAAAGNAAFRASHARGKRNAVSETLRGVIRRWWARAGAATPRRSRPCSRTGPGAGRTSSA